MKIYAACVDYEGCFAVYSTLEKAIEDAKNHADTIEEWEVDAEKWWLDKPVVWSRKGRKR